MEVGNPKMDAAALGEGASAEVAIAEGEAPLDLSPEQLLAVLDELFVMEASWHCGNSPLQTVYTCLYMLKLERCAVEGDPNGYICYLVIIWHRHVECLLGCRTQANLWLPRRTVKRCTPHVLW